MPDVLRHFSVAIVTAFLCISCNVPSENVEGLNLAAEAALGAQFGPAKRSISGQDSVAMFLHDVFVDCESALAKSQNLCFIDELPFSFVARTRLSELFGLDFDNISVCDSEASILSRPTIDLPARKMRREQNSAWDQSWRFSTAFKFDPNGLDWEEFYGAEEQAILSAYSEHDLMVTTAHSFTFLEPNYPPEYICDNFSVVFDFADQSHDTAGSKVPRENVAHCQKIIAIDREHDVAIFALDQDTRQPPLPLELYFVTNYQSEWENVLGSPLKALHHGSGLALMQAEDVVQSMRHVFANSRVYDVVIFSNLSSTDGSSGGAVFAEVDGEDRIVGMIQGGIGPGGHVWMCFQPEKGGPCRIPRSHFDYWFPLSERTKLDVVAPCAKAASLCKGRSPEATSHGFCIGEINKTKGCWRRTRYAIDGSSPYFLTPAWTQVIPSQRIITTLESIVPK